MNEPNQFGAAFALTLAAVGAHGADCQASTPNQTGWNAKTAASTSDRELRDAQELIRDAVQTVQQMKADPELVDALNRAKGVFLLPHYGHGALGVGFQVGEGVLVTREGENFGNPVFYDLGGISVGPQIGGSEGEVAFLLMTDRVMRDFRSGTNFSINADAGLTIARYSKREQIFGVKVQDVIVWSETKGAYAGASVGITDVATDEEANRAYYGRPNLTPSQVIAGAVENPHSDVLGKALGL